MKTKLLFGLAMLISSLTFGQIPRTDLLAEYLFDGGTLNDTSGNNAHLSSANNTVSYQTGINGVANSALVNNNNELTSPSIVNPNFNTSHRRTAISLWVKTGAISNFTNLITINGVNSYMLVGISSTKVFARTKINSSGSNRQIESQASIYDNKWHHIMVSRSYNKFYLYVDGLLVTSGDAVNFDFSSISIATDSRFAGELDNVRIYNRGFNDTEAKVFFKENISKGKLYVNKNVSGGNGSGDSWVNAMPDLQTALTTSTTQWVEEVWVAKGTYYPGTTRSSTFSLDANEIKIYGGFDGIENSISERDIKVNPSILSGDFNNTDTQITTNSSGNVSAGGWGDNTYHVVTVNANNTLIDGFEISHGCANDPNTTSLKEGSGVTNTSNANSINLKNCTIKENYSRRGGAVRANYGSKTVSVNIENCIFDNNAATFGAGVYIFGNNSAKIDLNVTNTLFINNISGNTNGGDGGSGSAIWARASGNASELTSTITNCTFAYNKDIGTGSGDKGPIAFSRGTYGTQNTTVNNSIFYHNTKGVNSSTVSTSVNKASQLSIQSLKVYNSIGEDNFSNINAGDLNNTSNTNPLFTSVTDFTLQSGSPAIDAGDNSKVPTGTTTDLAGNNRIYNTTVDMGAYEFGSSPLSVKEVLLDTYVKVYPNPVNDNLFINTNTEINKINVYNLLGTKVMQSTQKKLNVSDLQSGLYLIRIESKDGKIATKKFIKK